MSHILDSNVISKSEFSPFVSELFHTEQAHLRNLKILHFLFNQPMLAKANEMKDKPMRELAQALFPNMEEMISLHSKFIHTLQSADRTFYVTILFKEFNFSNIY